MDAFKWMGVVMIAVACIGVGGQYFPMWGGMLLPAKKGVTEEDYYFAEYSAAEREQGLHMASSAFVSLQLLPDIIGLFGTGFDVALYPKLIGVVCSVADIKTSLLSIYVCVLSEALMHLLQSC